MNRCLCGNLTVWATVVPVEWAIFVPVSDIKFTGETVVYKEEVGLCTLGVTNRAEIVLVGGLPVYSVLDMVSQVLNLLGIR